MKRRKFIQQGLAGAIAPVFIPGFGFKSMAASIMPVSTCEFDDRILVILYNFGANDIVNNMVPLNHFSSYVGHRPNIYLPEEQLITLDDSLADNQSLGVHPSLSDFKNSLYDEDMLAVIQRVGYPTPNRSHFASEDILLKGLQGTDSSTTIEDGWLGRFMMDRYPTYKGRPFGNELDPLGIILGKTPDTGFHTVTEHQVELNISGQDPGGFYSIISSLSGEPIESFANSDHGELLNYMSLIEKSTQVYSGRISDVFNAGNNSATYPSSSLGNQLKSVAKMISGGSRTKVYMTRKNGWDSHVNQVELADTTTGRHALLLKDVNDSVKAFQDDLAAQGLTHKVVTVVFSEFARKIIENGSYGTDHGTVSTMYIVGDSVKKGVYGDNIDLSDIDAQGAANPLQLQNDYRTVWGTILQDWFGANDGTLINSFPHADTSVLTDRDDLKFIKASDEVDSSCYFSATAALNMTVDVKLFLEGFLDGSQSEMSTNLKDNSLLPLSQPYNGTRFSYFGDESVDEIPTDVVDWVLVELHSSLGLVIAKQALFLRKDGHLVCLDGQQGIQISDIYPEAFRVVIRHRSHIGVMLTDLTEPLQDGTVSYDLTNSGTAVVQGENQLKLLSLGSYALVAGDMDQNGVINTSDYNRWRRSQQTLDYHHADLNADGLTNQDDIDIWKSNRSKIGNPKIHSALGS